MKKIIKLIITFSLIYNSSGLYAHELFDGDSLWSIINKEIKHLNSFANDNSFFQTKALRYFDKKTNKYTVKLNTSISEENIVITSTDNQITIKGKDTKTGNGKYSSQSLYQSFSVPDDADINDIKASFDNQILTITIPKLSKARPKFKNIKIN